VPTEYVEPLMLQVIGGYSCDEIGEMLGTSSGAVMTRVCRARQKLRHLLEEGDVKRSKKVKP
jgi:RNA polymerase sigma-70 factor, ECF subfamily